MNPRGKAMVCESLRGMPCEHQHLLTVMYVTEWGFGIMAILLALQLFLLFLKAC